MHIFPHIPPTSILSSSYAPQNLPRGIFEHRSRRNLWPKTKNSTVLNQTPHPNFYSKTMLYFMCLFQVIFCSFSKMETGQEYANIAQRWSACLACVKPWISLPALKKKKVPPKQKREQRWSTPIVLLVAFSFLIACCARIPPITTQP